MSLETAAVTIRGLLFADVFADLLQLKAHCGHCVSTGPEVLAREIPLFATQAGSSLWRSSLLEIRSRRPPDTSEGSRCTSSFFWLSPSHGGCYAQTERSNLFWSHWSNQWLT